MERLSKRGLEAKDLETRREDLVCASEIWSVLVDRLAKSPRAWSSVETVASQLKTDLHQTGLSTESKASLHRRVEDVASQPNDPRALRLCDLAAFFDAGAVAACHRASDAGPAVVATASAQENPWRSAPPATDPLRREIQLFQACIYDCGKNRSPDEVRRDEDYGKALLARNRICSQECGQDAGCTQKCEQSHPVAGRASVEGCVSECQTTYPNWNRPLPDEVQ
jgi:hypothetical protein